MVSRLESQAAENVALKQRAESYRSEAGALESRLALIKAQRNKLLAAFEGLAGTHMGLQWACLPTPYLLSFTACSATAC